MFKIPDGMHEDRNHSWPVAGAHGPRFWAVIGVFVLSATLGADLIWSVLEEGTALLVDLVAEQLERFYQSRFGLDLYHAQMATAYTGAIVIVVLGVFGLRKFTKLVRHIREDGGAWWHEHYDHAREGFRRELQRSLEWWSGLDLLNKSAVLVGLAVVAVPLAVILSYGLGMMVAEIL